MAFIDALLAHLELLPNFSDENQATFQVRCVVAHKTLFSQSFHGENIAKDATFSWRKSDRVSCLMHYDASARFHSCVYIMHQYAWTKACRGTPKC